METKKNYFTTIKNKQEFGEAEILYQAMQQQPEKDFCSKDIANLFPESGVSIASRLFKKLEINGLIYLSYSDKRNYYRITENWNISLDNFTGILSYCFEFRLSMIKHINLDEGI